MVVRRGGGGRWRLKFVTPFFYSCYFLFCFWLLLPNIRAVGHIRSPAIKRVVCEHRRTSEDMNFQEECKTEEEEEEEWKERSVSFTITKTHTQKKHFFYSLAQPPWRLKTILATVHAWSINHWCKPTTKKLKSFQLSRIKHCIHNHLHTGVCSFEHWQSTSKLHLITSVQNRFLIWTHSTTKKTQSSSSS